MFGDPNNKDPSIVLDGVFLILRGNYMKTTKHLLVLGAALALSMSACASHTTKAPVKPNKTVTTKVVKTTKATAKININKADLKTLSAVKGIGHKKAVAIIKYREKHGAFKSINDLSKVTCNGKKFSKKYIKRISKRVTV